MYVNCDCAHENMIIYMLTIVADLLVITVATDETDGFKQFLRSAKKYGIKVKVLFRICLQVYVFILLI